MERAAEMVLEQVKAAIRDDSRFASKFEPSSEGLRQEHGFWMVPVRLERFEPSEQRMQIYSMFAKLEGYLQSEKHLKVVLLPIVGSATG